MGPVAQHNTRSEVLDYAPGYMFNEHGFLYKRITKIQPDIFTLSKPFVLEVWAWVVASMLIVGAFAGMLHLAASYLRLTKCSSTSKGSHPIPEMFSRGFTWTWKIFLSQDLTDTPDSGAGRALATTWLFMGFMLSLMYRSNLLAILVNDKIKLPFNSIVEFGQQNEYKLTWQEGTIYPVYLKYTAIHEPDVPDGKLWAKRDDFVPTTEEVVDTALSRKVAVIAPRVILLSFISTDFSQQGDCRLALAETGMVPVYMTYGYPKKSPLKEQLDMMLLRVIQAGISSHLQDKALGNSTWCMKAQKNLSESRPLAVKDFFGLFLIYAIGTVFAMAVFIIEVTTHGRSKKTKNAIS
ncbi:glutamate receptor ionotropic, kainate 2 [Hyalella azteca]|uniref:Glutamate receptor ionotropic, kainate 2 n=1 Tax=Hyalella azteca TaxID=294128 RepID=A0A8B7NRX2_HYAAZ|nr:glutamate receptor ionotropic, kainate 2 [Hyalella azteca]